MKTVINGWTRKEFTTRGSDPTVVVEWSKDAVTIQEFQDCYSLLAGAIKFDASMVSFVEDLHKTLELAYGQARDLDEYRATDSLIEYYAEHDEVEEILEFLGIPDCTVTKNIRLGLPPLE